MCLLRGVEQDNGVIPGCEEGADPALAHRCGCRCEVISQHLQKEEQALALQMRKEVGFRPREGKGLSEAGVTGVGGGVCGQADSGHTGPEASASCGIKCVWKEPEVGLHF